MTDLNCPEMHINLSHWLFRSKCSVWIPEPCAQQIDSSDGLWEPWLPLCQTHIPERGHCLTPVQSSKPGPDGNKCPLSWGTSEAWSANAPSPRGLTSLRPPAGCNSGAICASKGRPSASSEAHEMPSPWHSLQSLGYHFIIWVGRNSERVHGPFSNLSCQS